LWMCPSAPWFRRRKRGRLSHIWSASNTLTTTPRPGHPRRTRMETYSGGCQCGAVRYRFSQKPSSAHVCHCRMCQKAFGAFYAPLVGGPKTAFAVTRGEIAIFMSSDLAARGFCRDCGTPLSFAFIDSEWISVSIGSLDR